MRVALIHHAEAESPIVDSTRPLTARGCVQADEVAARLSQAGFAPAAIWHSGKLRARQTAEAVLRSSPFASFQMVRGLRPGDPPDWVAQQLQAETRDVAVVGHLPNISGIALALLPSSGGVPLHGCLLLTRTEDGSWSTAARQS